MQDVYVKAASAGAVLAALPAWVKDENGEVLSVSMRHVADWDICNEQGYFLANFRFAEEVDAEEVAFALGEMVIEPQFPKRIFA